MTDTGARRLDDLLADLVAGLDDGMAARGIRPVSLELDLPVETRVDARGDGLVVLVDVPRTRTRTAFDRPVGRLAVRVVTEATP